MPSSSSQEGCSATSSAAVRRRGRQATLWVQLRKSVVSLYRYREICLQSNSRYLNALAQVDDPTPGLRALHAITSRKQPPSARPVKAFNPLSRPASQLFAALMSGAHALRGFATVSQVSRFLH